MVSKEAGDQAGQLLAKINAIWSQIVDGVDEIILASVAEFIHDSALHGYPDEDHWQDKNGNDRRGFSIPLQDFRAFAIFRAIRLGPAKVQERKDPWYTLSKLGMTPAIQVEIVSMISEYRFSKLMQKKIGSVIGKYGSDYVLVAIRSEAYDPMQGITELAKIAEISFHDKTPSAAKKVFDKNIKYRRGAYNRTALLKSLPANKFC